MPAVAIQLKAGADPASNVRCKVISSWIETWLALSEDRKELVRSLWAKQIPRLSGNRRWSLVKGPMRAAIATLLDLGWRPVGPDYWLEPRPSDMVWQKIGFGDLTRFLEAINESAMREHWRHAAEHEGGRGLAGADGSGIGPDLKPIKKRLKAYEDSGLLDGTLP